MTIFTVTLIFAITLIYIGLNRSRAGRRGLDRH